MDPIVLWEYLRSDIVVDLLPLLTLEPAVQLRIAVILKLLGNMFEEELHGITT